MVSSDVGSLPFGRPWLIDVQWRKNSFIPPPDLRVRIVNLYSKAVLFSRRTPSPQFGHVSQADVYDDQWWKIEPGTGSRKGKYRIVSEKTGWKLWCRANQKPLVGAVSGSDDHDDNWFEFRLGEGARRKHFRIFCPATGRVIVSRNNEVTSFEGYNDLYDDQFFQFLLEDMKFKNIEYDVKKGEILGTDTVAMDSKMGSTMTIVNDTDAEQTTHVTFTQKQDNEFSFEKSTGLSITVGTEFETGIPFVAEGKISTSVSVKQGFKWGETTKTGKGVSITFEAHCPPHKTVHASAILSRSSIEVPYTITWESVSTGFTATTTGKLSATQFYDAKYHTW